MIILFILGLLLGGISVIFALQNVLVVTVTFFDWQLTGPLSVILISAIISGILMTLLLLLPESISSYFKSRSSKKEIERLREEIRKQKEKTVFARNTEPTDKVIAEIEDGAITHIHHSQI